MVRAAKRKWLANPPNRREKVTLCSGEEGSVRTAYHQALVLDCCQVHPQGA